MMATFWNFIIGVSCMSGLASLFVGVYENDWFLTGLGVVFLFCSWILDSLNED